MRYTKSKSKWLVRRLLGVPFCHLSRRILIQSSSINWRKSRHRRKFRLLCFTARRFSHVVRHLRLFPRLGFILPSSWWLSYIISTLQGLQLRLRSERRHPKSKSKRRRVWGIPLCLLDKQILTQSSSVNWWKGRGWRIFRRARFITRGFCRVVNFIRHLRLCLFLGFVLPSIWRLRSIMLTMHGLQLSLRNKRRHTISKSIWRRVRRVHHSEWIRREWPTGGTLWPGCIALRILMRRGCVRCRSILNLLLWRLLQMWHMR
mmetsp:Transcript_6311/g.13279  ORF Transcript_6311/g.13279 Transcript_6311/m.13279 type:complete len:260 (-) Transcript_6311:1076-1855(-)